ncbi:MAG: VirB3 family type IV secretion system protein [Gemmatimonadota bacterium]|nr:VirB3 family type IV secretion system protein [Gemmatimonadota bacterium]
MTPDRQQTAEAHVIHASLYRPVLFAGAEPAVVVLEITTAFALVFVIGLHLVTVLLASFYLTVVHTIMVWVAKQDAHMTALYVRSLGGRDFYAPHAGVHAASSVTAPSIPRST